jgi:hypothetical protein
MTLPKEACPELSAKKLLVALRSESSSAIRMHSALQSFSLISGSWFYETDATGRPYQSGTRTRTR